MPPSLGSILDREQAEDPRPGALQESVVQAVGPEILIFARRQLLASREELSVLNAQKPDETPVLLHCEARSSSHR